MEEIVTPSGPIQDDGTSQPEAGELTQEADPVLEGAREVSLPQPNEASPEPEPEPETDEVEEAQPVAPPTARARTPLEWATGGVLRRF